MRHHCESVRAKMTTQLDSGKVGAMGHPMFHYDDVVGQLFLDYCRGRLRENPVPLDFGGNASIDASTVEGLITRD